MKSISNSALQYKAYKKIEIYIATRFDVKIFYSFIFIL